MSNDYWSLLYLDVLNKKMYLIDWLIDLLKRDLL